MHTNDLTLLSFLVLIPASSQFREKGFRFLLAGSDS